MVYDGVYTKPNYFIMPMNKNLLDIVVCPICKSHLYLDEAKHELICKVDKLAYPIRDDIPVMLVDEARSLTLEEAVALSS
ncbi:COG2835 Uncharacterized conserved protein [Burkholderiaceae bacterium]